MELIFLTSDSVNKASVTYIESAREVNDISLIDLLFEI